jgi:radical SAM protein with 4Fe4S-binding SPASM domain
MVIISQEGLSPKFLADRSEKIYRLIKRLGVDDWQLYRNMPISENNQPLDNEDIKTLIEKLIIINRFSKNKYKIANAIPFCSYDPEKIRKVSIGAIADDGHIRFVINSKGNAKPMYYLTENIGNILQESVMTIWGKKFMKDMRNLNFVPRICKRCRYIKICKGGSRFTSNIIKGSYEELDYLALPLQYKKQLFNRILIN